MLTALTLPNASRFLLARVFCGVSLAFFAVSLVGVSGCSGSKGAKNSVSGKVTLNGAAVAGSVAFVGSDNVEKSTPLKQDGSYSIDDPPTGQVKILVKGMGGLPGGSPLIKPKEGGPEVPGGIPGAGGASPPDKYGAVGTTPLSYEVKPGKHVHNIELSP